MQQHSAHIIPQLTPRLSPDEAAWNDREDVWQCILRQDWTGDNYRPEVLLERLLDAYEVLFPERYPKMCRLMRTDTDLPETKEDNNDQS